MTQDYSELLRDLENGVPHDGNDLQDVGFANDTMNEAAAAIRSLMQERDAARGDLHDMSGRFQNACMQHKYAEAKLASVRAEVIEECAKLAEAYRIQYISDSVYVSTAIAHQIRSLPSGETE